MKILYHQNFGRGYKKLPAKVKEQFKKRLKLFAEDPFHPLLGNHVLHGQWSDYRSINITGDFRAIYKQLDSHTTEFVLIDTHGNLY